MSTTPTLDQTREALAIAVGMKLQRATIAAALRKRHAELVASCESSPTPTPAHKALVAELALLVFWVESLPCDPPLM